MAAILFNSLTYFELIFSFSDGKMEEINLNKVSARIKKLGYELSDFVDSVRKIIFCTCVELVTIVNRHEQ